MNEATKSICGTLGEVRKLLDILPIAGKAYRVGLVNADNALETIIHEIESGHIIVSVADTEEKSDACR